MFRAPGDQQHRRQERSGEQSRDGRRRFRWASGSQLCTGAQPILAASPASSSRYATSAVPARRRRSGGRARRARRGLRRGTPAASMTMPSSAMPSPSDVRIRYFQPASSARAFPLKPTRSADAAVVASIEQPGDAQVPGERHREQHRPEGEQHDVVRCVRRRPPRRATSERSQVGGRDEHAGEPDHADHADEQARRRRSTAIQSPSDALAGSPSATAASAAASAAVRNAPPTATRDTSRRGVSAMTAAVSAGSGEHQARRVLPS